MVELKPYETFPLAVFIDGVLMPKQLIKDPIIYDGFVEVTCYTNTNSSDNRNIKPNSFAEHWFKESVIEPKTDSSPERTTFYLKYSKV